ncbi:MAG TPA: hypothetical protein VKC54_02740 [Patescibacteria group bacterium]|nr:hypothetical protein [Patescibacteria group bacterium]
MRSARKQKPTGSPKFLKFIILGFLIVAIWIFLVLDTKYWNGTDKFDYVYRMENGDVAVMVLDPELSESTSLIIPGDTQVSVAGNYGTLRIKNVWQLGLNEKVGGRLLAATTTKNFLMPTFLWSDSDIASVENVNLFQILKFIFIPKNTNIPIGDRVSFVAFSLRVKNINRTTIDLAKSQFLKKTNLSDGQMGYVLLGPVSGRLTNIFSDNDFSNQNVRVNIVDATGVAGSANIIGQIIEVIGGKVVSVDKKPVQSDTDCLVLGANKKIVKKIATLFGCKISGDKSSFDLEIRLGELFANRY